MCDAVCCDTVCCDTVCCDAVCCDAVCCDAVCCCRYSVDVFQPPVQTCSERDASTMMASSTVVTPSQPNGSDGEDSQSALGTGSGEPLSSQSSSLLSQDESLTTTFGGSASFADTEATPTDNETASCANTSFSEVTVETNGDSSTATVGPCGIFGATDNGGQSVLSATSSDVDTGYGSASTSMALGEGPSYVWQANGPGTDTRKGTEEERGKVPMSYVMGRQQDIDKCPPQFYLKPCDREGRNLSRPLGQRIEDHGKNAITTRCMRERFEIKRT